MKLTIDTKAFATAVRSATGATDPRIDGCGWLYLRGSDELVITGTDAEVWLTENIDATGTMEQVAVPASLLDKLASQLRADTTTLVVENGMLDLRCGQHHSRLPALIDPMTSLAARSSPVGEHNGEWTADHISRLQRMAKFASDDRANKPALSTVRFKDGTACAMDGYRLVIDTVPWGSHTLLVPASSFRRLPAETLQVSRGAGDLCVEGLRTRVQCRLIEAPYPDPAALPDWRKESLTTIAIADTSEWVGALKRMMVYLDETSRLPIVDMKVDAISGIALEVPGLADEPIDTDGVLGEPINVSMNARYFVDLLELAPAGTMTFHGNLIRFAGDGFIGAVAQFRRTGSN